MRTIRIRAAAALAALLLAGCEGGGSSVTGDATGDGANAGSTNASAAPDAGVGTPPGAATPDGTAPVTAVAVTDAVAGTGGAATGTGPTDAPDAPPALGAALPLEGSFRVALVGVDVRRRSTGERLDLDVEGVVGAPLEVALE